MPVPVPDREEVETDPGASPAPPPSASSGTTEPAATIRDRLVRGMVRRNERFGATRFHLHLKMLRGASLEPPLRASIREALTLGPVVGLILEIGPDAVSEDILTWVKTAASGRERWLELRMQPQAATGADVVIAASPDRCTWLIVG